MTEKSNGNDKDTTSKKSIVDPVFSAPEKSPLSENFSELKEAVVEFTENQPSSVDLTTDDPQPAEEENPTEKKAATSGKSVLVVEDEPLIRLDIVEILEEAGYVIIGQAENGEKAVELAEELYPDLVVMDVKMPIMDGISAAEKITEARIAPVVLLTAFSQKELVKRASKSGAMAYVVKPFSPSELIPALEIALARQEEILSLEDEVEALQERFETRKLVDRAKSALTTKMGLSEPEAFRWIQKTSMDRRLSMREVAETVINQVK